MILTVMEVTTLFNNSECQQLTLFNRERGSASLIQVGSVRTRLVSQELVGVVQT